MTLRFMKRRRLYAPADDKPDGGGGGDAAGAGANDDKAGEAAAGAGSGDADKGAAGGAAGGDAAAAGKGAGDGKAGDPAAADPWGDLRTKVATKDGKVDEKILTKLGRYATPADAINALLSIQGRISAGEFRSVLPKDANDAALKLWREENGIPADPKDYKLALSDGLVVGKEDQPIIDAFLASAHKANLNAAQASAAVDWYYGEIERQTEARAAADAALAKTAQDELRAEWGTEYRANENMVMGLLDAAPAGVKDQIMHGRLADGKPIMSDVATVRWLNQLAREINPIGALIPNAGANASGAIEDEIKSIETTMRTDRKAYDRDTKMQARLRELYDARERAGKK